MTTELENLPQVLDRIEVKQFPFPGVFYCHKVLQLSSSLKVPAEISLYVITENQTVRSREVIGIIIDIPNTIDLDSDTFGSIMEQIRLILLFDIAKNSKLLVLHKVAIKGLPLGDRLPNLEVLHLHHVSFVNEAILNYSIYFGKDLKELHIILDEVVDEVISLELPLGLKRLKAYFDKTEKASKQALWFRGNNSLSLKQM
jgi:hypothetical protein